MRSRKISTSHIDRSTLIPQNTTKVYTSTGKTALTTTIVYSNQTNLVETKLSSPTIASLSTRTPVSRSRKQTSLISTPKYTDIRTNSFQNSTKGTTVTRKHSCSDIQIKNVPKECTDGMQSTFKVGLDHIISRLNRDSRHIDYCIALSVELSCLCNFC